MFVAPRDFYKALLNTMANIPFPQMAVPGIHKPANF